jgi:hypothetical protein
MIRLNQDLPGPGGFRSPDEFEHHASGLLADQIALLLDGAQGHPQIFAVLMRANPDEAELLGNLQARSIAACIAPMAIGSLAAKTAPGGAVSWSSFRIASYPPDSS